MVKISVILPVYNVAEYLPQCLESVINQDFKDIEIICVDDASTDNSLEILKNYAKLDSRIKIIQNEKNSKVGISRNIGLENAGGEYIHFLDPDDWLQENSYKTLIDKVKLHSDPEILYFQYQTFDNKYKTFEPQEYKNTKIVNKVLHPIKNASVFDNWDRHCWSKLIKKEFLTKNNIKFNNLSTLEDIEYAALLYINCNSICYIDDIIVNYRINRTNSLVTTAHKNIKGIIQSFENNKKLYEKLPDNIKYKLLGFDYYQIRHNIQKAYNCGFISTLELIKTIKSINSSDSKNYIYNYLEADENELLLNFPKIFIKRYFPSFFNQYIKFKKRLFNLIQKIK